MMKKAFLNTLLILMLSFSLLAAKERQAAGFDALRVISDPGDDSITVIFSWDRELSDNDKIIVTLTPPGKRFPIRYRQTGCIETDNECLLRLPLNRKKLWSPDNPALYQLTLKVIIKDQKTIYNGSTRFGIRSLETHDGRFYLNGLPFYVRAYGGEGGCGCDQLSRDAIRKRLTRAREYGFNAVRNHTHIPKDSYMKIADEVGILVQMEIGGNQIGDDVNSARFSEWRDKWVKMIRIARKHPSTFIYGCGNEMYGNSPGLIEVLDSLYSLAKSLDPGTLVLNRSGSNPFNDAYGTYDLIERPIGEYEHTAEFAHQAFEAYLRGDRKGRTDEFPIIAHEYPLVASYPNPDLIAKYDSIPYWIDTTIAMAKKNGLDPLLPTYVRNTEAIQAQVRKEMLEEARKFPELDGYSMLRFTDCGAYVSGVVDDFSDPKNVTAEEFLQTNGETVLLCSWNERVLTNADTLRLSLQCSHHGGMPFELNGGDWEIYRGGEEERWRGGNISDHKIPAVDVKDVAIIEIPLNELDKAQKLTLKACADSEKKTIRNEWEFWVFPKIDEISSEATVIWDPNKRLKKLAEFIPDAAFSSDLKDLSFSAETLILTDSWDERFYDHLNGGGKIWVLSGKTWPWPEEMGIFGLHITRIDPAYQAPPVFPQLDEPLTNWLTVCSNHPKRYGNSGTVIFDHPALGNFPHDGYCDMQFWPMIYRAKSLRLRDFPQGTQPMIQAIDNFYRGEHKGYLVDMQVGKGRLLISTLNLIQHLDYSASTRYMTHNLFEYMTSDDATAGTKISSDDLKAMIDRYADDVVIDPPRVHSEMAARYKTLWERRLSPGRVINLYPYEAVDVSPDKLHIHYEYAQTQWYYKAAAGDELLWSFDIDVKANYDLFLHVAGIFPDNNLTLSIDGKKVKSFRPHCSGSWQDFHEIPIRLGVLIKGEHTLSIKLSQASDMDKGVALHIRDLQIKEIIEN